MTQEKVPLNGLRWGNEGQEGRDTLNPDIVDFYKVRGDLAKIQLTEGENSGEIAIDRGGLRQWYDSEPADKRRAGEKAIPDEDIRAEDRERDTSFGEVG